MTWLFKITTILQCPYRVIFAKQPVMFICMYKLHKRTCQQLFTSSQERWVSHSIHHRSCHHHCQKFYRMLLADKSFKSNLVHPWWKIAGRRLGQVHIIASWQVDSPSKWVFWGGCGFFANVWQVCNLPLNFFGCSTAHQLLQNPMDLWNLIGPRWAWQAIGCEVVCCRWTWGFRPLKWFRRCVRDVLFPISLSSE